MFATKELGAALVLVFVFSAAAGLADSAVANPDSETLPVLAMPVEYVNYTITCVNGSLWAKIDEKYPLHVLAESGGAVSCVPAELRMVYPTPPGTTNIHLSVNGRELVWNEWLYDTHHTALGDWEMICCVVSPVSDYILLTIHYEHPVAVVNGSYLFLYDLNISPYLTPSSNSSVAYFTVRFETKVSDIRAYTAWTDSVWNPKDFTLSIEGDVETVAIEMRSVLGEPLAGDLVVMFDDSSAQVLDGFPWWLIALPVFALAVLIATFFYRKKKR